jgi:hypothetical protein
MKSVGRSCHWRWPRRHNFNVVAATIPKWRTFKLLRWMRNLYHSTQEHEIFYSDRFSEDEQLLIRPFCENEKLEYSGRLIFKIHILSYVENSQTFALSQLKFCTLKDHGHTYNFYLNHYFLWRNFWVWQHFEVMRLCLDKHRTTLCSIL